jgi:hypothetical protein
MRLLSANFVSQKLPLLIYALVNSAAAFLASSLASQKSHYSLLRINFVAAGFSLRNFYGYKIITSRNS